MTDEQWLWLFTHQAIDRDEKLNGMCDNCRDEVTSGNKCSRCGKPMSENESFVNENFDMEKYEALKNGTYVPPSDDKLDDDKPDDDIYDPTDDMDESFEDEIYNEQDDEPDDEYDDIDTELIKQLLDGGEE